VGDTSAGGWDDFDYDERVVAKWPLVAQRTWYAGYVPCRECGYSEDLHPRERCTEFNPTPTPGPPPTP
jgi:hypothetical protein